MRKIRYFLQKTWVKRSLIGLFTIIGFFVLLYLCTYLGVFGKLPSKEELSTLKQAEASQVLDKNEKLIGKYYIYDRQPLTFQEFPQHLLDALIATEDARFYEHSGVDNISLLRVFIKNILLGDESAGGGSTITLQLAKNLYNRKDYALLSIVINKFRESIIARRIERIYDKEEILALYLNTVSFPDNTYGIESASQKFFNKTTSQLTIAEAATLVGTLKANSYYNPRVNIERSKLRRDIVLDQMVKYNHLVKDSAQIIKKDSLILDYHSFNHDVGLAPYFRAQVKKELQKKLKEIKKPNGDSYDLYRDGLVIHTTLDASMQKYAEESMKEHLKPLQKAFEDSYSSKAPWHDKTIVEKIVQSLPIYKQLKADGFTEAQILDTLNIKRDTEVFSWEEDSERKISVLDSIQHFLKFLNTGMLSIEPQTGAIRTYIGGIDYRYFKYDHVSQSERQVGSTFKPIVYTAAIENGMKPCKYYTLDAITYTNYDDWKPSNSGNKVANPEHVNYSLEKALSQSVNTIAVKVLNDVGINAVIQQAEKMGITKELPKEPSLALGVAEISLKEVAGAYASFVNNSIGVNPYFISKIEDKEGNILASYEPEATKEKAYSDYTRQVLLQMMKETVNSGTASRLRSTYNLKNALAGKTGTTQDNKDGWFVGITPNLVTVTWVGNDNYNIGFKTTGIGQGANSALPIFAKFYQKLNADSEFNSITKSNFEQVSQKVLKDLDCKLEKEDGFFKRLFRKKDKSKKFKGQ